MFRNILPLLGTGLQIGSKFVKHDKTANDMNDIGGMIGGSGQMNANNLLNGLSFLPNGGMYNNAINPLTKSLFSKILGGMQW